MQADHTRGNYRFCGYCVAADGLADGPDFTAGFHEPVIGSFSANPGELHQPSHVVVCALIAGMGGCLAGLSPCSS
jgi:hypothetical protein